MFCKTLKVSSHLTNWAVLLPVFERYSPMNLLVRYRTVRAVNTQNLDKHSFTCWIKEVHIEDKESQLQWVIPLLLTAVIFLYSQQCSIWEGTSIEGRLRSSLETTRVCFFLNDYARDACGSNLYWIADFSIAWRNFPRLLHANSTSAVLNKWWPPCTKSRGS